MKQCRPGRQRTSGQELTACKSTRTEVDSVTWNAVIGKCSLEDPVSEEESMGAEQFEGSREFNNNVGRAS